MFRSTYWQYQEALAIAIDAHKDQKRHNGEPYVHHPIRVATALFGKDIIYPIVAVLHDVVEDSKGTPHEIKLDDLRIKGISEKAIEAIDAVTRRKSETYVEFVIRASQNPIAKAVKEADIVDNLGINGDMWFDAANEVKHARRIYKYMRALAFLRGKISEEDYLVRKVIIQENSLASSDNNG